MDDEGGSWVGKMYQKFEAMCQGVEETLNEDAVKFVERQVQKLGTNVKRFYTDVMHDLVSQDSTDSVKLPVAEFPGDSFGNTKIDGNNSSSNKEDTMKVGNLFSNDLKVIDHEDGDQVSSFDEHVEHSVTSCSRGSLKGSFAMQDKKVKQYKNTTLCCEKVPKKDCCDKYRKTTSDNPVSDNQDGESSVSEIVHEIATTEHIVLASPQDSIVVGWKWDSSGEDEKEMESCEDNDVDEFTVKGPISTNVLSSRTTAEGLAQDSIETDSSIKSNVLGDSKTSQSTSELVALSDSGSISKCDKDVIGSNDSMDQKMKRAHADEIEVEDTVFVNENNISFVSYKDKKPRSYKKKMKGAFSSKKKSIRQEYKKLVKQFEDVNASSSLATVDTVARTLPTMSSTAELQTCESDWEVL